MRKVLILGGGMSAISSARTLAKESIVNVILRKEEFNSLAILFKTLGAFPHHPECLSANNIPTYDLIVRSPGIPNFDPLLQMIYKHQGKVISEIELGYLLAPMANYIAITGSNGKTTTASLLYHLLFPRFSHQLYLAGNIGVPLTSIAKELTNESIVILEVSSFQLEDIDLFSPKIALITNLSPNHLDSVNTLEEYYNSKMNLLKNLKSGYFILNSDQKEIIKRIPGKALNIIPVGKEQENVIFYDEKHLYYLGRKVFSFAKSHLKGDHNKENMALASAAALASGLSVNEIVRGLETFTGVPYRLEFIKRYKSIDFYNDSKSTSPMATLSALKVFSGQKIYLLLGGKDKKLSYKSLADVAIEKIYAFGEIRDLIKDELVNVEAFNNLQSAFEKLLKEVEENSVVLFSPGTSSLDQYRDYKERGAHFSELVRNIK